MTGPRPFRSIARLVLAALLAVAFVGATAASPSATVSAASPWTGGVDLYRSGVFTTQKTWLWCTAADTQIMRNIVDHATDHSRSNQQRYFTYMRAHNRYAIPLSDGVDPAGWAAGLRHFVDSRYRLVASGSFNAALRSAVTNLRKTNRPVGITVAHGNHAWILTGFTATADPATTTHFSVTSVRVVGPLWGLQSRSYGYDMRPDRKLTPSQFKGFFTPWHYARIRMAWEGDWVSVQPIAGSTSTSTASSTSQAPTVTATENVAPSSSASASAVTSPNPSPDSALAAIAGQGAGTPGPAAGTTSTKPAADAASTLLSGELVPLVLLALAGLAVIGVVRAYRWSPSRRQRASTVRASARARTRERAPARKS
jgi:hypothetical protein